MRKIILIVILWGIFCQSPSAFIINEVLANEPESNTTLEWIELYNNQVTSVSLSGFEISLSNGTIVLPDSVTLAAGEYYIICRKLFDHPSFETVWGDSSGVWGDTPYESSLQQPYETSFSLRNGSDYEVIVLEDSGTVVSGFVYIGPGLDGYSWERVLTNSDDVLQSFNWGGTPGLANSVTPVSFDLSLDSALVFSVSGSTVIDFYISNKGDNNISGSLLDIYQSGNSIDRLTVGSINFNQSIVLSGEYIFTGMYLELTAALSQDDRPANNQLDFTAVGTDFPPLILTELMANPSDDLNSEWVEIKNISTDILDLSMWFFGDELALRNISDTSILIGPDEYFILAASQSDFMNFYFNYDGIIVEPPQWSIFNNTNDILRLNDMYNIEADRFAYDSTFSNNRTWSRIEEANYENMWGRSTDEHGTPGFINSVFFSPSGDELTVTIDPTHFSPDGDGFEDETVITINFPRADDYTVKIYDKYGREVKAFYDGAIDIDDEIQISWDGKSDGGIDLPIGIYILYIEANGVMSQKETIVIAR